MSAVTIFVAPRSQRSVLAALGDLSQLGLAGPFAWIEAPENPDAAADKNDPHAIWIQEGIPFLTSVAGIVNRHDVTLVRLIVVVPVGHEQGDSLSEVAEYFYQGIAVPGGTVLQRVRVVVPWTDSPETSTNLGRQGWHNVMLSPEATGDPKFQGVPWWTEPSKVPGAIAVALMAQGGIAGVVTEGPNDTQQVTNASFTRVSKTYVRITDAAGVEDNLRDKVLDMSVQFPCPTRNDSVGQPIMQFSDYKSVCVRAADEWAEKHERTLRRPIVMVPPHPVQNVGFWAALKMFFSFIWASLKSAPQEWIARKVNQLKSGVASSTTRAVFGDESAYQVIVGKVDGLGRPAHWEEVMSGLQYVGATGSQRGPNDLGRSTRNTASMWTDLCGCGISLLDGSPYGGLGVSSGNGYVPDRTRVIGIGAGIQTEYVIPEQIGRLPAGTKMKSWDDREISWVLDCLDETISEGGPSRAAAVERVREIMNWRRENEQCFLPRIGRHLGAWWDHTQNEISESAAELDRLDGESADPEVEQAQRSNAVVQRILLGLLTLLPVVAVILASFGVIDWKVVIWIGVIAVVSWLIGALVSFISLRRKVFLYLHRRERESERVEQLREHLHLALDDLGAIADAYAQFTCWASILSSFVADPLGDDLVSRAHVLQNGELPDNVDVQQVTADEKALANVGAILRARSFPVGWLTEAWKAFEETVTKYLSPDQLYAWQTAHTLKLENDSGTHGSALSNWAEGVQETGILSSRGQEIWDHCLDLIGQGQMPELGLKTVEGNRPLSDFRRDLESPYMGMVVGSVLSEAGIANEGRIIDSSKDWFAEEASGLSTTMVLIQSTKALGPEDFIYQRVQDGPTHLETDDALEF